MVKIIFGPKDAAFEQMSTLDSQDLRLRDTRQSVIKAVGLSRLHCQVTAGDGSGRKPGPGQGVHVTAFVMFNQALRNRLEEKTWTEAWKEVHDLFEFSNTILDLWWEKKFDKNDKGIRETLGQKKAWIARIQKAARREYLREGGGGREIPLDQAWYLTLQDGGSSKNGGGRRSAPKKDGILREGGDRKRYFSNETDARAEFRERRNLYNGDGPLEWRPALQSYDVDRLASFVEEWVKYRSLFPWTSAPPGFVSLGSGEKGIEGKIDNALKEAEEAVEDEKYTTHEEKGISFLKDRVFKVNLGDTKIEEEESEEEEEDQVQGESESEEEEEDQIQGESESEEEEDQSRDEISLKPDLARTHARGIAFAILGGFDFYPPHGLEEKDAERKGEKGEGGKEACTLNHLSALLARHVVEVFYYIPGIRPQWRAEVAVLFFEVWSERTRYYYRQARIDRGEGATNNVQLEVSGEPSEKLGKKSRKRGREESSEEEEGSIKKPKKASTEESSASLGGRQDAASLSMFSTLDDKEMPKLRSSYAGLEAMVKNLDRIRQLYLENYLPHFAKALPDRDSR